jgi:3-hydroxybutyryl-CoA dehydrogenase
LDSDRYAPAAIVERNMKEGRIGLKTGGGFLDYKDLDLDAYREQRLRAFADRLKSFGLSRPPVL